MLIRIVKMGFAPEHVDTFLTIFDKYKEYIRGREGCQLLELYQENNSTVFFTYSYWNSEEDLQQYRNSNVFKEVWSQTKALFNQKPEAWSVTKKITLP